MSTLQTIRKNIIEVIESYHGGTVNLSVEENLRLRELVKQAFLAGQQSVLECARGMKIPKEFESKWNYYQGYSYEWAIGYNRMADALLSAPLNDTEI